MFKHRWVLILFFLFGSAVRAQESHEVFKVDQAPLIDGRLDEPFWKAIKPFSDFKTVKPDYGFPVSEKTEFYLAYDRTHLYAAFRCFESEPAKIKASLSKHDSIDLDDWMVLALDTFNDQQSSYIFGVNPLGIQMDGTLNQDGNSDLSLDMVWKSMGRIDESGYTVEMAIPFKSLRFPFKKKITMGMMVARYIGRKSEQAHFPEFDPQHGSMLTQFGEISLYDIKYERTIEWIPALTYSHTSSQQGGKMTSDGGQADFSLTGKLGLTSDLTLDATYNPDFSQVEADAGQIDVNLRYALYYSEKRPFFLEGMENFNLAAVMEASPLSAVVHTRNIVDPSWGFKLTGKIGKKNILSTLFAIDEYPKQIAREEGNEELYNRNAFFTILRYKRVMKKDSYLGGFFTSREYSGQRNRLVGLDGRIRVTPKTFLEYSFFESFSRERGESGDDTGEAVSLRYNYSTRNVYYEIGFNDIGKKFRTDVGYLTRNGVTQIPLFFMYSFYPKSNFLQRIDSFYWAYQALDRYSNLFETFNIFVVRFYMPRQSMFRIDGMLGNEVFSNQRFNRNGWRLIAETQIFKQLYLSLTLRGGKFIYYDPDDPFQGKGSRASFSLIFQPTEAINSSLDINYEDLFRDSNSERIYDYTILRSRTTFQPNKYLFFRAIIEYNTYWKSLNTDFLASFTYIPGTVVYVGYGSVYEKLAWDGSDYVSADDFLQTKRAFFFKASYLWRF